VSHLGENVTALVDSQLSPVATERAHVHLAHCRGCRDLVEAERLMKARLTSLPAPAPGAELVGRLLALGGPSGPMPPRPGHVPGSPRPASVPLRAARARSVSVRPSTYSPSSSRPAGRPVAPRRVRLRLAGAVLGALGVVGAGVTGLVLAGPQAQTAPVQANFGPSVGGLSVAGRSPASADVSLELRRNGPAAVRTAQRPGGGR
jgi:hypothetical protein